MVKIVIGDETQLKLAENRLTSSGLQSQVGLLIGKLSSKLDRGFVYDLVPTPPNDEGEPPCSIMEYEAEYSGNKRKSSSKPKSQIGSSALVIDKDWVAEHARQVAKMLLGGMEVVGIYIWANEGLLKSSTSTLCQTIRGVAEAASSLMTDWSEKLLLHISYGPLRWTCRNCSLSANIISSGLQPCDFKLGKILDNLQTFRCSYNFDIRMPIAHADGLDIKRFADILRDEITCHAKELAIARALMNGKLVIEDEQCASGDFHEVEFLLPLLQDKYPEVCSQKEILGILLFRGCVCSLSYLNPKEPVSQALIDLKADIVRSLQSRLEILRDDADREWESRIHDHQDANIHLLMDKPVLHYDLNVQRSQFTLSFPRRVFVPWLDGTYICDYVQSSETVEVLKDHCMELLSTNVSLDASEILEPESSGPTVMASSIEGPFCDIGTDSTAKPGNHHSTMIMEDKNRTALDSADFKWKLALLVLITSILMGPLLYFINIL